MHCNVKSSLFITPKAFYERLFQPYPRKTVLSNLLSTNWSNWAASFKVKSARDVTRSHGSQGRNSSILFYPLQVHNRHICTTRLSIVLSVSARLLDTFGQSRDFGTFCRSLKNHVRRTLEHRIRFMQIAKPVPHVKNSIRLFVTDLLPTWLWQLSS